MADEFTCKKYGTHGPALQPKWPPDTMNRFTANEPFNTESSTEEVDLGDQHFNYLLNLIISNKYFDSYNTSN